MKRKNVINPVITSRKQAIAFGRWQRSLMLFPASTAPMHHLRVVRAAILAENIAPRWHNVILSSWML